MTISQEQVTRYRILDYRVGGDNLTCLWLMHCTSVAVTVIPPAAIFPRASGGRRAFP